MSEKDQHKLATVTQSALEIPSEPAGKTIRHFGLRMVLTVMFVCMGTLSYSYGAGVIGTTVGQPSFYTYMQLDTNPHAEAIIGTVTSLYYAGGVFGSFFSNFVGDRWGRKASMCIGAIIVLVTAALCAGSVHIAMFIVFRFFAGFGGFMLSMSVPLWILEVTPPEVRGAFAQCHAVGLTMGYLLSSYVGVGFYTGLPVASPNAWRGPQAIGALPPLLFLCGLWWLPESPRFLFMKGRIEEARAIILKMHVSGGNDHLYSEIEEFQMRKQIELDRTLPSSWLYMFKRPSFRKRIWMTVFIGFAVLSTGNLVIAIYATIIMSNLGFDTIKQLLIQAGIFASVLPGLIAAIFYTEKMRRPTLVAGGLAGVTVVLACYTAVSASFPGGENRSAQIACVVLIYIFEIITSATGEGPLAYWAAEFYPTHLRAKGQTVQTVTYACVSILWGQSSTSGITNIGWKFFLVFISITAVTATVIFFYFPDTQGKSLEEVALLFGDHDLVVVLQRDIHINDAHHIKAKLHLDGENEFVEDLKDVGSQEP